MQIIELINIIEKKFDPNLQEKWDNSGLQVGDTSFKLKNILLCLDVTEEAIDEAIKNNCNLIISHHPIIFPSVNKVITDFKGKKIIKAIKNDICIYSTHTPSDLLGFNTFVFNKMGFNSIGKISKVEEYGYGDYANIDLSLDEIIERIKKNLNLDRVIFYGKNKNHKRVGLVTGSGMDFVDDAINKGIDLFITGDVKHHDAIDSVEKGLSILDIFHEGGEKHFVDFFENYLKKIEDLDDIKIYKYFDNEEYLPKFI